MQDANYSDNKMLYNPRQFVYCNIVDLSYLGCIVLINISES